MKLLELFAWSRSIWKEAEKMWYNVFSVDWEKYEWIDLSIDIWKIKKEDVPFIPDVLWASPDCTTYSIAACSTHRNLDKTWKSPYAKECDRWNKHWISIMKEWLEINPNMIFFIENPRWNLRHMDFMKEFKRHTVWYCQYWDERAKPTDIWTNSKTWIPKPMCRNYKYDKDWNIINKHCHHESARRWARTWTQWRKNAHERSKIPQELCIEILNSVKLW